MLLWVGQYFTLPDAAAAISGKIGRVGSNVEESVLFLEIAVFDLGVVVRGADEAGISSIATGAERIIKGPTWCKKKQNDTGVTCVTTTNCDMRITRGNPPSAGSVPYSVAKMLALRRVLLMTAAWRVTFKAIHNNTACTRFSYRRVIVGLGGGQAGR